MKGIALAATLLFVLLGVASAAEQTPATATADIKDAKGTKVGTATFTEVDEGVDVTVEVTDLSPGDHGIHIHQAGKCDPPGFQTAGEHFNPTGKQHGKENPKGPHAGDLPNLTVGEDGKGILQATLKEASLKPKASNSLLGPKGTAIVIHADPDDLKSDPAGNSGDRIACGIIHKKTE